MISTNRPTFILALLMLAARNPLSADEAPVPAPAPYVFLTDTVGQVTLTLDGVKGPPIIGEMPLEVGDVIQTGPGSHAEISFDSETLVRLGANSALKFRRLAAQEIVLNLWWGTLLSKVQFDKKAGKLFSVTTAAAAASVTGTEFVVEHLGTRTRIAVLDEGHVAVKAPGFKKRVVMHFNQETSVVKGSPPLDVSVLQRMYPHKIPMAEIRQHLKVVRKASVSLTAAQREMMRAGWVKTHTPQGSRPRPRRSSTPKTTSR